MKCHLLTLNDNASSSNIWFIIGIGISILAYIVVSILISKKVKDANDYYVAGRNAPTILIVGSLIASYFGTGAFTGDLGVAYMGMFAPLLLSCGVLVIGYPLGAIFFGRYLRRSKVKTIPEFFATRFNSRPIHILATIIAIVSMMAYLISCMQGVGVVVSQVTGLSQTWVIIIAMCCFAAITILGGSRGVLITDTIMFLFFTLVTIIATGFVAGNVGGWFSGITQITQNPETSSFLSWGGASNEYLSTNGYFSEGWKNIVYSISIAIAWIGVVMVGPWQSSRYLMAKNEQVVMRSTIVSTIVVSLLGCVLLMLGIFIRVANNGATTSDPSTSIIWAALNAMPLVVGVLLVTGIIMAGMSSATTFLSLSGSSVANDFLRIKDDKKNIKIGKISILAIAVIATFLSVIDSPAIWWIMQLGTSVVAAAYLPVSIASIWSKRVTKKGAFFGMLTGFVVCFGLKLFVTISKISLPIFLDPFLVSVLLNVIVMTVVSKFTKPTEEEMENRNKLFIVPEEEKDIAEHQKTKKMFLFMMCAGFAVTIAFIALWVVPYLNAK